MSTLNERYLASEQRHAMSYERWLEYVATDAETQLETARRRNTELVDKCNNLTIENARLSDAIAQIGAGQKGGK